MPLLSYVNQFVVADDFAVAVDAEEFNHKLAGLVRQCGADAFLLCGVHLRIPIDGLPQIGQTVFRRRGYRLCYWRLKSLNHKPISARYVKIFPEIEFVRPYGHNAIVETDVAKVSWFVLCVNAFYGCATLVHQQVEIGQGHTVDK